MELVCNVVEQLSTEELERISQEPRARAIVRATLERLKRKGMEGQDLADLESVEKILEITRPVHGSWSLEVYEEPRPCLYDKMVACGYSLGDMKRIFGENTRIMSKISFGRLRFHDYEVEKLTELFNLTAREREYYFYRGTIENPIWEPVRGRVMHLPYRKGALH